MKRKFIIASQLAGVAACTLLLGCRSTDSGRPTRHTYAKPALAIKAPEANASAAITASSESAIGNNVELAMYSGTSNSEIRATLVSAPVELPIVTPTQAYDTTEEEVSSAEAPSSLTLNELLDIAVSSNPTLAQAYALVQQAQGNWSQVGLYPNPTLEWHDEANNAEFDAHYGVVSQELVTAGKLKLNRVVASHDVRRARWEAEAQRLRVLNEVQIRFIMAWSAQGQVAVAQDLLRTSNEVLRTTERLWQGEEVSEADVLQARLQQNDIVILHRNAQLQQIAAWQQLTNVVGRPDLPLQHLTIEHEDQLPVVDWNTAWLQVCENSPTLQAARSRATAAMIQVQREHAQVVPNFELGGGAGVDALPANQSFPMFMVKAGTSIPIYDRNQGNITAAMGEMRAAQWEVVRLELNMRDGLADAFQRYQSAQSQTKMYHDQILRLAQDNLTLTRRAYEEGALDFLRVLTAQETLFDAQVKYVSAITDLRVAGIEIQGLLLTGGLDAVQSNPTASNTAAQTSGHGN